MEQVSQAAGDRLLNLLRVLENAGEGAVTSARLEALTGWPSHTIRKDISCLDGGKTGGKTGGGAAGSSSGYAPAALIPLIKKALGLDRRRRFCVVGLGRLGSAYLNSVGSYGTEGSPGAGSVGTEGTGSSGTIEFGEFELAAGFDTNVNRVEILKSPAPLYPAYKMAEVIPRFGIEMALLCVPAEAAQTAAEKLAAAGIRGIVNFAPAALTLPPEIAVRNVHVADELRALAIRMP